MNLELNDKVVLVTGGARGIGEAIVHGLSREGATPVVVDKDERAALALQRTLAGAGMRCESIIADLTDPAACADVVADALRRTQRLDALVNNAGVNDRAGLRDGSVDAFVTSLHRNLVHCYAMTRASLDALTASCGSIVNIASKVALTGQGGTSGYAASKGGLLALTREWAVDLAPLGIRVNSVVPAEVMTPLYRQWLDSFPEPETKLGEIVQHIPLGHRMTTTDEIASAVLFLLSARASHITAQHIHVDGGYVHLDRALT